MFILKDTQKVRVTFKVVDAEGQPAAFQNPVITAADPTVVTVDNVAADGLSADVESGAPGTTQVNFTADGNVANDGSAPQPIAVVSDVQVIAGPAVSATATFGTPEDKSGS